MSGARLVKGFLVPALILTLSLFQMGAFRPVSALPFNVNITGFAYSPPTLTVHSGDTVIWKNSDPLIYELYFVKASDGSPFALSPFLIPGDTYSLTFPSCGTFDYISLQPFVVSGTVKVLIQGDVNGDGFVNFIDLGRVGAAFLTGIGNPAYDPEADLNNDGAINFLDLGLVGANFLKVCTP